MKESCQHIPSDQPLSYGQGETSNGGIDNNIIIKLYSSSGIVVAVAVTAPTDALGAGNVSQGAIDKIYSSFKLPYVKLLS